MRPPASLAILGGCLNRVHTLAFADGRLTKLRMRAIKLVAAFALAVAVGAIASRWLTASPQAFAVAKATAGRLQGQVLGGGAPIANSTVTLWAASAGEPKQLRQIRTGADGRFAFATPAAAGDNTSLYLTAAGGVPAANKDGGNNPAIALMTVLGSSPPASVTINEMTTVASVWTNAQFLDGTALKGQGLSLKIAAGNVPNLVDVETGGYGTVIEDALNSTQTPTMANFGTLSTLLAGCVTRVAKDACGSLFKAAAPPTGKAPTDTLTAAEAVARNPS